MAAHVHPAALTGAKTKAVEVAVEMRLTQDVRYALRQLRKTPAFTITAILTLALGIGANAAIFTLVNAVLLRNLPVSNPSTLLRIGDTNDCCVNGGVNEDGDFSLFATQTYEDIRKSVPEFTDLAAIQAGFSFRPVTARRGDNKDKARSMMGEFVSGNYFRTLGLRPLAGRLFSDTDDRDGAPTVAILSYAAWQSDFAADPSVVGSTFWINTKAVTIAGIAPKGFYGDRLSSKPPDIYLPIESMPTLANAPFVHNPRMKWLYLVGRVKAGTAVLPLQQKVSAIVQRFVANDSDYAGPHGRALLAKVHVVLTPGGSGIREMQERYASKLHLLLAISGLVLLIACANVANLLLVRGMERKTEMSVRTALGASRRRIVGQLLTESLLLAGVSGVAGLIVAYAGTRMLLKLAFVHTQTVPISAAPSLPVLGFALGLSLGTGVVFGVAPAWIAAQAQPADALRSGTRTTTGRGSNLQRGLVVMQAALSLVLLVSAGLFAQSLNKLENIDLKLQSRNRAIVHFNPQGAGYSAPQPEGLYRTIEQRFHTLPGVQKVGLSTYTPMEQDNSSSGIQVQGQPKQFVIASFVKTNAEYFDSVGTRIVDGRGFTPNDTPASTPVAVINRELSKQLFGAANPLGQHIALPGEPGDFEVVGVAENTAYTNAQLEHHGMYFVPLLQRAKGDPTPAEQDESLFAGAIVLQTSIPAGELEALTARTLASINPNLSIVKFQTFDAQIADQFSDDRMIARLTMLFGVLALLLAAVGLYGVTSYSVARRTSEIGIRMALGARRFNVVSLILHGAMTQAVLGICIGVPAALFCVRYIKTQLYGVEHADPSILIVSALVLGAAAALAGLLPAIRAASTNPVQALKAE